MSSDPDDYALEPEMLEHIFERLIVHDLRVMKPEPVDRAEVILLGGQPGAGAANTHRRFIRELADRGRLAVVSTDLLRVYHPAYDMPTSADEINMRAATQPAAEWWQERAVEWLREQRYNILNEMSFANPSEVLAQAESLHDGGCRVRVVAMGVPAALSRLTTIESFTQQLESLGTAWWTEMHDAEFDGTSEVVRLAEESPAVQQLTILAREGVVWDRSRHIAGQSASSAADALRGAREPAFSRAQETAIGNTISELVDRLEHLGPVPLEITEMATLVLEDIAPETASQAHADVAQHLTEAMRHLREANATLLHQATQVPPPEPPAGLEPI